jgi:hypothetical protein
MAMTPARAFRLLLLAFAFAAPLAAAAQTAPSTSGNSLAAQTNAYFTAVRTADAKVLSDTTSPNFHVILPDGKRLSYDEYYRRLGAANFLAQPPMGMDVKIKSNAVTATGATESVDTLHWYGGATNPDNMGPPLIARDFASHQLTWTKSPSGAWLLDEDHITSYYSL